MNIFHRFIDFLKTLSCFKCFAHISVGYSFFSLIAHKNNIHIKEIHDVSFLYVANIFLVCT